MNNKEIENSINELNKETSLLEERKNKHKAKDEIIRSFSVTGLLFSLGALFIGYFIHPIISLAAIIMTALNVIPTAILVLYHENKIEKLTKEIEKYTDKIKTLQNTIESIPLNKDNSQELIKNSIIVPKKKNTKNKKR